MALLKVALKAFRQVFCYLERFISAPTGIKSGVKPRRAEQHEAVKAVLVVLA